MTNRWDPHSPLTWTAPGPGGWNLDRSHANRPATPITQRVQSTGTLLGTRRGFIEFGAPLDGLDFKFVNGLLYSRIRPLINPDKPAKKLPPLPVLKLLIRLHPEMRKRAAAATSTLARRPWRDVITEWSRPGGLRDTYEQQNLALQDVDLRGLTDDQLVAHVQRVVAHATTMFELHFWLHNYDLGPIGILLEAASRWGLAASDVIPLLEGASPSTSEAERVLRRIRMSVEAAGASPATLDELRSISSEVATALDQFLRLRGHIVFSRYDLDGLTLAEAPQVLLATILNARDHDTRSAAATEALAARTAAVRVRVPANQQDNFDEYLTEARAAMDLRDDNGPHTLEWPLGLTRLALLEVGRRLVEGGTAHDASHALELDLPEVAATLAGTGVAADEMAARQRWRQEVNVDDAPRHLGDIEPVPPIEALPEPMARVVGFIQRVIAEAGLDGELKTNGLEGVGIGSGTYRGTARVASSPEAALEELQPGDVLVVPCTTPAYNMVLAMAGAVVTAEGGALSHAAVLARELGIPAVVGAPRALHDIPDGATIEVDANLGVVRVIA